MSMVTTGTVVDKRKNVPDSIKPNKIKKKMKKGNVIRIDKTGKIGTLLEGQKTSNSCQYLSQRRQKMKWQWYLQNMQTNHQQWNQIYIYIVLDYTEQRGRVDKTDHSIAQYQFCRRRKMFFWLLEVCIVNLYSLYTMNLRRYNKYHLSHKKYRKALITVL